MAFTVVDFPTAALAAAAVRSLHFAPLPGPLGTEVGTMPADDPPVDAEGAEEPETAEEAEEAEEAEGLVVVGLPVPAHPDSKSPDAMVTAMMNRRFIAFLPFYSRRR